MNRDILFRGKRVDNGKWEVGSLFMDLEYTAINGPSLLGDGSLRFDWSYEVSRHTVGQYTNFRDKRASFIFEGDVFGTEVTRCVVEMKETGEWVLRFTNPIMKGKTISILDRLVGASEIIGNIFDNPELITHE